MRGLMRVSGKSWKDFNATTQRRDGSKVFGWFRDQVMVGGIGKEK
jgi:hypothetical protein